MFRPRRRGRVLAAALLLFCAACSKSPTGPSPTPSSAMVGTVAQGAPPVPPRLDNGTLPTAVGMNRFVAFGDSITYGTTSSFDGAFLFDTAYRAYPVRLGLGLNEHHAPQAFTVINRGVPGERASGGLTRIASVLSSDRPQALLLLEGINDLIGGRSAADAANDVASIVDTAQLFNVPVVVSTMFQTYESDDPDTGYHRTNGAAQVVAFNSALVQRLSGRQNVFIVDMYQAFGSNRSLLGGDGLHPTDTGYQVMAQYFEAAIEMAFPVRGAFQ